MPLIPRGVNYCKYDVGTSTFGSITELSDDDTNSQFRPQIAIDEHDNIHVAWDNNDMGVKYKKCSSGVWGVLEEPINYELEDPVVNISTPSLCLDTGNNPHIAVVTSGDSLEYTTNITGPWESEIMAHSGISGSPVIGEYENIFYIAYCISSGREEDEIEVVQKLPLIGWIAPDVIGAGFNPTLSILCGGEVYVVWTYEGGEGDYEIMMSYYDGVSWTPPSDIGEYPYPTLLYSNRIDDTLRGGYCITYNDYENGILYFLSNDLDTHRCNDDEPAPEPESEPEDRPGDGYRPETGDRDSEDFWDRRYTRFHRYRRCCYGH
jgi:hypothetical protein